VIHDSAPLQLALLFFEKLWFLDFRLLWPLIVQPLRSNFRQPHYNASSG
jgi:hypothetical protein